MKLLFNALIKFISGILIVGLLVFLPAGTLKYTGGILFMLLMFIPVFILGVVLFIKSPELLKKRLDGREKETSQKSVVVFSAFIFLAGFIIAGLDFRFCWSNVVLAVKIIASLLFLISYLLYGEVMRENVFLSRKIEVQENQTVVDGGLYGIVRHPMYGATVLLFLSIPLVLGSLLSFLVFLPYPLLIAKRIKGEEEFLEQHLGGYKEYKEKVRYRLIPFIW